ncbi:N-acetylmuramoyl-L-alanine amidase [Patulibacter minatonensis]|uniref:N-acetylmuramoyl-L-alanine amidase n=1 Tax=Patulibacter minatonensis TaxID=298163 RepID=UPI0004788FD8|nr:N-acetylmuramoyl-L-alanine amidase [Patulibacter minatonensis]
MTSRTRSPVAVGLLAGLVVGGGAAAVLVDGGGDDGPRTTPTAARTTETTTDVVPARATTRAPGTPARTTTGDAPPTTSTATTPGTTTAAGTSSSGALRGLTVVVDPGHNGQNASHPAQIDRQVDVGNGRKACNTTGTESVRGLAESRLNLLLAKHVQRALEAEGATVRMTRSNDDGVGPCVDRRARIANAAKADASISIHGDGGPASGRGFHVILPGRVPQVAGHDRIVATSAQLGRQVRRAYREGSGLPYSTYLGRAGLDVRTDLGGLNLLKVPGVMIETGNMRNATDASRMSDPVWRREAGRSIAAGVRAFLLARR